MQSLFILFSSLPALRPHPFVSSYLNIDLTQRSITCEVEIAFNGQQTHSNTGPRRIITPDLNDPGINDVGRITRVEGILPIIKVQAHIGDICAWCSRSRDGINVGVRDITQRTRWTTHPRAICFEIAGQEPPTSRDLCTWR